jgi:hypothetical protein
MDTCFVETELCLYLEAQMAISQYILNYLNYAVNLLNERASSNTHAEDLLDKSP